MSKPKTFVFLEAFLFGTGALYAYAISSEYAVSISLLLLLFVLNLAVNREGAFQIYFTFNSGQKISILIVSSIQLLSAVNKELIEKVMSFMIVFVFFTFIYRFLWKAGSKEKSGASNIN